LLPTVLENDFETFSVPYTRAALCLEAVLNGLPPSAYNYR